VKRSDKLMKHKTISYARKEQLVITEVRLADIGQEPCVSTLCPCTEGKMSFGCCCEIWRPFKIAEIRWNVKLTKWSIGFDRVELEYYTELNQIPLLQFVVWWSLIATILDEFYQMGK